MSIIKSICDNDLYKFTMMQVVYMLYTGVFVRYDFKCRNGKVLLPGIDKKAFLSDLNKEIREYCYLQFTPEELQYFSNMGFFKENFIEFLSYFKPKHKYIEAIIDSDGDLRLKIEGPWISTILFEVPLLAIISELFHRYDPDHLSPKDPSIDGVIRLMDKVSMIKSEVDSNLPFSPIICDLGTRRRYSYEWHMQVIRQLVSESCNFANGKPFLSGTSNVHFSRLFNIKYVGTMAHEYVQAHQQLGRVEDSQKAAFQAWADIYRGDLGIALSDTVGKKAFFKDFDKYFAKLFDGARHDSGDAIEWGKDLIRHYKDMDIDPKTKTAVFSDGLTAETIISLYTYFQSSIKTSFGIGTNLTNDVSAIPLQIVMKMTECNGRPVAKISDSPGKGMCLDKDFEKYIRGIFC